MANENKDQIKEKMAEAIFEKNFLKGMILKDYSGFKRNFPTLKKVIIQSIVEGMN